MQRLMTLKEFENEWKAALALACPPDLITKHELADDTDPFDCSSLKIPSTHALVNEIVQQYVEEWRELDERKILNDDVISLINWDEHSNLDRPRKMARKHEKLPKWYTSRVRLPEQFDYASKRQDPPLDNGGGDRVLSLFDPTSTLSYHQELWKLFNSIPLAQEIESNATANVKLPYMQQLSQRLTTEGTKPTPDSVYALSRLRYSDRHDAIPAPSRRPLGLEAAADFVSTIQFECWRRQLKRGASPDSQRMSIELRRSQTLRDFHLAIVELTDDELWDKRLHGDNETAVEHSGFFFIEGIFYTYGSVDYVTPIQFWLTSGTKAERRKRAQHLGLPVDVLTSSTQQVARLPVVSMAETRLEDIATRLGFRYVHVHHGDVECSVFCVDRKFGPEAIMPYPILHDVWTPNYVLPDCEACQSCPAVIATSTTCERTLGHAALCEACSRQLGLQIHEPDKIELYCVWRSQVDLSTGASTDKSF